MAVIIPSNSGHSGDDPPAEYVIAYLVVALIVWIVVAVAVTRREAADQHRADESPPVPDKDQLVEGVLAGLAAAVIWPVSLVAVGVWRLVRRLTQPRPVRSKEESGA